MDLLDLYRIRVELQGLLPGDKPCVRYYTLKEAEIIRLPLAEGTFRIQRMYRDVALLVAIAWLRRGPTAEVHVAWRNGDFRRPFSHDVPPNRMDQFFLDELERYRIKLVMP